MAIDLGETTLRPFAVYDSTGALVDADSTPTYAITLPDGTAGIAPAVQHAGTGEYYANYATVQAGWHQDYWTALVGGIVTKFGDTFHVRPSSPAGLLSMQEVRRLLRIYSVDPDRDEELRDFLDAATKLCEQHTGRTYRRQTVSETFDGGRTTLILSNTPVLSVTTVVEAGAVLAAANWTLDLTSNTLTRGSTAAPMTWIYGRQNITVTYVVGTPVVSPLVRQAVKVTLRHLWSFQRGGSDLPRQAGSDGDYSTNAPPWSLPREAEQLLANDVAPGFG